MSAMREDLIGYLLHALEPAERAQVETELGRDPELKRELELLERSLLPLAADREGYAPPLGLASRCCEFVATHGKVQRSTQVVPPTSRWRMSDLAVAAGVFLAATLLFWPAMNQSRYAARVRGCQNNMRQIGMALQSYSDLHPGKLPAIHARHELNRSGLYAVILLQNKMLGEERIIICPASDLADEAQNFNVPTLAELEAAAPDKRDQMLKTMGGSYGFSLGYHHDNGDYTPPLALGRSTHVILADAPSNNLHDRMSGNHGACGQNLLFEDFHVEYVTGCRSRACRDHIFENRNGDQAAGLDRDDVVIGSSDASPFGPQQSRP
jgi:hypothetical protein